MIKQVSNHEENTDKGHIVLVNGATFQISGPNLWILQNGIKLKSIGYRVTIICQDRNAQRMQDVNSYIQGEFPSNAPKLKQSQLRVVVPYINDIVPVYAAHQECSFQGVITKPIQQMTQEQIQTNIKMSAACLRAVCLHDRPFKVISNYMILSGIVVARGLQGLHIPFDIIAPGPALRFTIMPYPNLWKYIFPGFQKCSKILQRTQFTKRLFMKCFRDYIEKYRLKQKSITIGPGISMQNFVIPESYAKCQQQLKYKIAKKIKRQYLLQKIQLQRLSVTDKFYKKQTRKFSLNAEMGKNQQTQLTRVRQDFLDNWIPFSQNDETLLYVGAIANNKGIGQLVAILPKLIIARPTIKLIICGSGPEVDKIYKLLEAYQENNIQTVKQAEFDDFVREVNVQEHFIKISKEIRSRIIYIGLIQPSILQSLYPLCTLYIAPNRLQEECNMTILEAMCCGVTPVCNDHSWFSDVMDVVEKEFPQLAQVSRVGRAQFYERLPQTILATLDFIKNCGLSKKQYRQKIRNIVRNSFSYDNTAKIISQQRKFDQNEL